MDISSIITGIVIAIVLIAPSIYFATAGKRKLKNDLNKFLENLKEKFIHINDYDQLSQYIIGIDNSSGFLVYKKGTNEPELIDLKNILNCNNNIPDKNKRSNISHNLYLELVNKNSHEPKVSLEIYDSTFLLNPTREIKLIEKWTNKINSYLKNKI